MLIATNRPALGEAIALYHINNYGRAGVVPARDIPSPAPPLIVLDCVQVSSAFRWISEVAAAAPESRLLALVARPSDLAAAKARGAGAHAILSDSDAMEAWTAVLSRIERLPFQTGPSFAGAPVVGALMTVRQAQVYDLVIAGATDEETAQELGIAVATAETHRRDVQQKLSCGGHHELVVHAVRHGLLDPGEIRVQSPLRRATRSHSATG